MNLETPSGREVLDLTDDARLRELTRKLQRFLEWMNHPEPEDAAQEALLRGITRIKNDRVEGPVPVAFFVGIGRHLVQEGWRLRKRAPVDLEIVEATHPVCWDKLAEDQVFLEELLTAVPKQDRDVFERYHHEDRQALSQRLGISLRALRVKVHRIRVSLEDAAANQKFNRGRLK